MNTFEKHEAKWLEIVKAFGLKRFKKHPRLYQTGRGPKTPSELFFMARELSGVLAGKAFYCKKYKEKCIECSQYKHRELEFFCGFDEPNKEQL